MSGAPATPEVSVIIPCHNSTKTLGLQLEALANQTGAPTFEVIVSDNGSTDGLEEFVEGWRDRLAVRYVDSGRLKGAGFARNVGMSGAAAGKWMFCDADDVVARDWVAQGSAALEIVEVFSGPGLRVTEDELTDGLAEAWELLDSGLPPGQPVVEGRRVPWPILLGGNSGLRREAALSVGGYDAAMGQGAEDNDLAVRIQLSGGVIAAAPGARILYRARDDAPSVYRASLRAGVWHMALCQRYGLWDSSPHLRGGRWALELPRVVASGVLMGLKASRRDWPGLASRAGLAMGMWRGWLRFCVARRLPKPAVGVGIEQAHPVRSEARRAQGSGEAAPEPHLPTGASDAARAPRWLAEGSVLVVSPHLDDALFSASEIIRRADVEVWTVFAGEPQDVVTTAWDTAAGFADSHEQLSERKREDERAFGDTGARVRYLSCLDSAYTTPARRDSDLRLLRKEVTRWIDTQEAPVVVLPAGAGVPVRGSVIDRVVAAQGSPTWPGLAGSPLLEPLRRLKHRAYARRRRAAQQRGLAVNGDHLAVRDAVLRAVMGRPKVTIVLAEDLPYLWWHPADDAVASVAARWNVEAAAGALDVDRQWKFDRIRHYASQLDLMDGEFRRLSSPDTLPSSERHWVLTPSGSEARSTTYP